MSLNGEINSRLRDPGGICLRLGVGFARYHLGQRDVTVIRPRNFVGKITQKSPQKLASDIQPRRNDVVSEKNSEVSAAFCSRLDALVVWIESTLGSETFYQLKSCVLTAHWGL